MAVFIALLLPATTYAAWDTITYQYDHHIFSIDPDAYPEWWGEEEILSYKGQPLILPEQSGTGDVLLPFGVERSTITHWKHAAIASTLATKVGTPLFRGSGSVVISKNASGSIVFDGVGLTGRAVRIHDLVDLTIAALESGITNIVVPVDIVQPAITIKDSSLVQKGIKEVVAVGESNFRGSPAARRHNIEVGLSKFNGHIIPKDSEFSFNEVLGPVNASTGYWRELVILGERTLPEYGGGLCQVSTTAYRGIWEYGFPIVDRRNHSYAVSYYSPQGTDATIYPPNTDMKFLNDSPGDLLMQTYMEGDQAYFVYYGTHDDRVADVYGPYLWNHAAPPAPRTEFTTDIPAGTERIVGHEVVGMNAAWFRTVQQDPSADESEESYFSWYQARPLFTQIGVDVLPEPEQVSSDTNQEPIVDVDPEEQAEFFRPNKRSIRSGG